MQKKLTVETITEAITQLNAATSTLKEHYATEVQWRLKACSVLEVLVEEVKRSNPKLAARCEALASLGREL